MTVRRRRSQPRPRRRRASLDYVKLYMHVLRATNARYVGIVTFSVVTRSSISVSNIDSPMGIVGSLIISEMFLLFVFYPALLRRGSY
jgi:polyferredoxin